MTGWSNGLSQDYNGKLGTWFADRLGARNQLRNDMETKNEALELANYLEICDANEGVEMQAAAMLRAQAADIERLTNDRDHLAANNEMRAQVILALSSDNTDFANERDQLKAVIEQLNQSNTSRLMQILVDDKVVLQERVGQLKAKNQKLEDALRELMGWQVKNVKVWSNSAYDNASRTLKENT